MEAAGKGFVRRKAQGMVFAGRRAGVEENRRRGVGKGQKETRVPPRIRCHSRLSSISVLIAMHLCRAGSGKDENGSKILRFPGPIFYIFNYFYII
jgi:hypothetical protein